MTHDSLGHPESLLAVTLPAVSQSKTLKSQTGTAWAIWRTWVAGGRETAKEGHSLNP